MFFPGLSEFPISPLNLLELVLPILCQSFITFDETLQIKSSETMDLFSIYKLGIHSLGGLELRR